MDTKNTNEAESEQAPVRGQVEKIEEVPARFREVADRNQAALLEIK